jgi:hypothetical protein
VRSLSRSAAGAVAIAFAVVAVWSVDQAASNSASHSFPSFFTPGKLAYCKLHRSIAGESSFTPYLNCWRPRDGFTVTLESKGRPLYGPLEANRGPVESVVRASWLLRFGHAWWGNQRGDDGRGRGEGRVLFRCTSRTSGLTCRSISGHGFWLGRVRGYRIF